MSNQLGMGLTIGLKDNYSSNADRIRQKHEGLSSTFEKVAAKSFQWNQISGAIQGVQDALDTFVGPGMRFEAQVAEMSAITGVTGAALDDLASRARNLALEFGGSASDNVESFKTILSRLGPEIAGTPEALDLMGRNVSLLAKTMGDDAVGATDALTTGLLQYNVDITDAAAASREMTRQMDMMTQAANVGSAEVPQIAAALKVAGGSAYNAGLRFEETQAAIQVLGKAAMYGSEAGTGLRNVLAKLGEGRFIPKQTKEALMAAGVNIDILADKTIPLSERLKELSKIQNDSALVSKFFGTENQRAAMALLNGSGDLARWTEEIRNSSGATQVFADTVMGSFEQRMKRFGAWMEDVSISVFDAVKGMLPFVQMTLTMATNLTQLGPLFSMVQGGLAKMRVSMLTAAASGGPFAAATTMISGGLRSVAASAWAAIAPLLPIILAVAAAVVAFIALKKTLNSANPAVVSFGVVLMLALGPIGILVGGIMMAIRGVKDFKAVMEGKAEPKGGILGFIQKIGGVLTAVVEIFSTAGMEGFSMSRKMRDALERMGILDFVVKLGTWITRLKAFFGGVWQGIKAVISVAKDVFNAIGEAVQPVFDKMTEWGLIAKSATGTTQGWAKWGKVLGIVIGTILVAVVVALTIKMVMLAIATIAAFIVPLLIIAAVIAIIWAVIWVVGHWGEILDWLGNLFVSVHEGIVAGLESIGDWFLSLPGMIWDAFVGMLEFMYVTVPVMMFEIGVTVAQAIWDGIKSVWASLMGWFGEQWDGIKAVFGFGDEEINGSITAGGGEASLPNGGEGGLAGVGRSEARMRAQQSNPFVTANVPPPQVATTNNISVVVDGDVVQQAVERRQNTESERRG